MSRFLGRGQYSESRISPATDVSVTGSGSGYVDIDWLHDSNQCTGILAVAVPSGGSPVTQRLSATASATRFSGLLDGTLHSFYVYRIESDGQSSPSTEVTATPSGGPMT